MYLIFLIFPMWVLWRKLHFFSVGLQQSPLLACRDVYWEQTLFTFYGHSISFSWSVAVFSYQRQSVLSAGALFCSLQLDNLHGLSLISCMGLHAQDLRTLCERVTMVYGWIKWVCGWRQVAWLLAGERWKQLTFKGGQFEWSWGSALTQGWLLERNVFVFLCVSVCFGNLFSFGKKKDFLFHWMPPSLSPTPSRAA